jgi:hypothetical protein
MVNNLVLGFPFFFRWQISGQTAWVRELAFCFRITVNQFVMVLKTPANGFSCSASCNGVQLSLLCHSKHVGRERYAGIEPLLYI